MSHSDLIPPALTTLVIILVMYYMLNRFKDEE